MEFRILFSIEIISPGLRLFLAQPRKKISYDALSRALSPFNCACADPHIIDRFYICALQKKRHTPTKKRKQGSPQRVFVNRPANISIQTIIKIFDIWSSWVPCHWQLNEETLITLNNVMTLCQMKQNCTICIAWLCTATGRFLLHVPRSNFTVLYV